MTGIVLLEEGLLEADVRKLAPRFGIDLAPLIANKTQEKVVWQGPVAEHEQRIASLFDRLEQAERESPLPEMLPNRERINDFLVRRRLDTLRSPGSVYNVGAGCGQRCFADAFEEVRRGFESG
jgi:hypothetical protein